MSASASPVATLASLPLEHWRESDFFQAASLSFGRTIGLQKLGISYDEVPPGSSACPFHNHHMEEELFVILEGEGTYRYGNERLPVKAGDVLGAPTGGPETAHQIINTGSVPLKFLSIANNSKTEVCEYPDSGKFQVTSRVSDTRRLRHCGREGQNHIDYWDGEVEPGGLATE